MELGIHDLMWKVISRKHYKLTRTRKYQKSPESIKHIGNYQKVLGITRRYHNLPEKQKGEPSTRSDQVTGMSIVHCPKKEKKEKEKWF